MSNKTLKEAKALVAAMPLLQLSISHESTKTMEKKETELFQDLNRLLDERMKEEMSGWERNTKRVMTLKIAEFLFVSKALQRSYRHRLNGNSLFQAFTQGFYGIRPLPGTF
jgi:hypothetical protein